MKASLCQAAPGSPGSRDIPLSVSVMRDSIIFFGNTADPYLPHKGQSAFCGISYFSDTEFP